MNNFSTQLCTYIYLDTNKPSFTINFIANSNIHNIAKCITNHVPNLNIHYKPKDRLEYSLQSKRYQVHYIETLNDVNSKNTKEIQKITPTSSK